MQHNHKIKDTSIELKIEQGLKDKKLNYIKQVYLCKGSGIVDFYLPQIKVVIECDGNYWHNLPNGKMRDERKDFYLSFNGFKVYRFKEDEINRNAHKCIEKIREVYDGV